MWHYIKYEDQAKGWLLLSNPLLIFFSPSHHLNLPFCIACVCVCVCVCMCLCEREREREKEKEKRERERANARESQIIF